MNTDTVAVYRNEERNLEIEVQTHTCEDFNPLEDEEGLRFLTARNDRYRHGTEQLDREALDAEVAEAYRTGAIVLPVYMMVHGAIGFRLADFGDHWDSGQCGFILIADEDRATAGLTPDRAIAHAGKLLEQYAHWCNGWGFRYTVYETQRCNLGELHRREQSTVGGYLGTTHEETGLLEDAGIRSGQAPVLCDGWTKVGGPSEPAQRGRKPGRTSAQSPPGAETEGI